MSLGKAVGGFVLLHFRGDLGLGAVTNLDKSVLRGSPSKGIRRGQMTSVPYNDYTLYTCVSQPVSPLRQHRLRGVGKRPFPTIARGVEYRDSAKGTQRCPADMGSVRYVAHGNFGVFAKLL